MTLAASGLLEQNSLVPFWNVVDFTVSVFWITCLTGLLSAKYAIDPASVFINLWHKRVLSVSTVKWKFLSK